MIDKHYISRSKIFLFGLLLVVPVISKLLHIPKTKALKGNYLIASHPTWRIENWFDGTFQKEMDGHLRDDLSLRGPAVRWKNQWQYNLLDRPNARFVVKGKEGFLYEDAYIKAALGMDYLGRDSIEKICSSFHEFKKSASEQGVKLLVVLAPGKGSYFPEYIPNRFKNYQTDNSNFKSFKKAFDEKEISYIDMKSWFEAMKDTTTHPLFPKTGIHWSSYGMSIAADSLLRYLEKYLNKDLTNWSLEKIEYDQNLRDQDRDIEEGLNLRKPIANFPMAYPVLRRDTGAYLFNGAVVADSYFWNMYNYGFCSSTMNLGEFWYYGQQVYPQSFEEELLLTKEHVQRTIPNLDVIIFIATDATLNRFPWNMEVFQKSLDRD